MVKVLSEGSVGVGVKKEEGKMADSEDVDDGYQEACDILDEMEKNQDVSEEIYLLAKLFHTEINRLESIISQMIEELEVVNNNLVGVSDEVRVGFGG